MAFPITFIDLAGAIALLLWGAHMVQTGVQRAFGPRLRLFLGAALKNRFWALLAGIGVTALLQSSTATGLMTAGFAASGLVELAPGLAVMLGANIGTTLIVQLLSFNVAAISPCFILVGVILFRKHSSTQAHDLGRVFIGLGLMLLALHQLLDMMTAYEDAPSLRIFLGAVSTEPVLDVLLAAALTWAAHSSVAVVLFVMSLAAKGVVPPDAALALVLGANLGAAINPVVEGAAGGDLAAKRLPIGNALTRLVGAVAALPALHAIGRFMVTIQPDNARLVADFHTLFNLATAAIFFPLLTPYASFLRLLLPRNVEPNDPSAPLYLDPAAKETPIVAIGAAAREALRLSDVLNEMLVGLKEAIEKGDRKVIAQTRRRDEIIDRLEIAIKAYVTSLDAEELSAADARRIKEILTFASHMEQAGDTASRIFLHHVAKHLKRNGAIAGTQQAELARMIDRLRANLRMATSILMTEDPRAARDLADEKVAFREVESKATAAHFDVLRTGQLDAAQRSALYLDLIRDVKLINSQIVASAAYPILERSGELLPNRRATDRPR
jgi:phosphate:Na+ symporter